MGSGIFTRKAGELIFHDKIQQSSSNFTRFGFGKRSNHSAKKIIVVGIGKVTQFSVILSHRDKQAIQHTSKQAKKKKRQIEKEKGNGKRGWIKRQGWSGGEENERQMANNVMRGIRVCDGYLVCLDLTWLGVDLPSNGARNTYCYLLSMRWFSLEEERVMQQSSVSISLSFREPGYQSSRRLHPSHLVPTQTNKNLATNAVKGLSIPSRPLARVRSDRDD